MKGIIIYTKEDYKKNKFFVGKSKEYLKERDIDLELVFDENLIFACNICGSNEDVNNDNYIISHENKPDFAIVRCINPHLSWLLEMYGIKIFNSAKISKIANDKFNTYLFAKIHNINTIPTILFQNGLDMEKVKQSYMLFDTKELIIKSVDGHGGSEVFCINMDEPGNEEFLRNSLEVGKKYLLQPRIKGRARDVRIYILDNKAQCAILRESTTDYRSNFSLGGVVREITINDTLKSLVKSITDNIYLDYAGIDFIIDENEQYYFNEIEDVVGARMLYQCTDIDIISRFMCHIIDKVSEKYV